MMEKVAVGCGGCGQQGRIPLDRLTEKTRCKCGSRDVDLIDVRKDTRARFIAAAVTTYSWDPDPVGDAWRAITSTGHILIVDLDIGGHGFYGVIEDSQGDVVGHYVFSNANLQEAKRDLEAAYGETILAARGEQETEYAVFGSRQADYQTIDTSTDDTCSRCGGTGNDPDPDTEKCVECGGSGKVRREAAYRPRRDIFSSRREAMIQDILSSNPDVSLGQAASLAREADRRYHPSSLHGIATWPMIDELPGGMLATSCEKCGKELRDTQTNHLVREYNRHFAIDHA